MSKEFRRRNHYVPQFYLNHWASKGNVCVYNTLVSSELVPIFQTKNPKGIAYIDHFYTNLEEKQESDEFEHWINTEVENPYFETQNKIFAEKKLTSDDYRNLVRYAMAQYLRVPKYYVDRFSSLAPQMEKVMHETGEQAVKSFERIVKFNQPLPERAKVESDKDFRTAQFNTFSDRDGTYIEYKVLFARDVWLGTIKRLVDRIENKTKNHRWKIVKSLEGQSWVTSDNPVTLLRYKSKDSYDFKGAWAQKNVDIFMPISPQYLLYTAVGKKQAVENSERLQTLINKMIIENAFLQVYSTAPDSNIPKIRPRVVDEAEYKRIQEMLKSWHEVQTEGERKFFDNKNFG